MTEFATCRDGAASLLKIGMTPVPEDLDPIQLAIWTCVARGMFNVYETMRGLFDDTLILT